MENVTIKLKKYLLATLFVATLIGYLGFQPLIHTVDLTAAPIDYGVLSAILIAAIAVLGFIQLCLWLLHHHWPVMGTYAADQFEENFNALLPWQKISIYLGLLLSLLYAFVLALQAIL